MRDALKSVACNQSCGIGTLEITKTMYIFFIFLLFCLLVMGLKECFPTLRKLPVMEMKLSQLY